MPVVICPSCKAKLKAPDQLIGKSVKCPGCASAVLVKAVEEAPAPRPQAAKPQAIASTPAKKKPPVDEVEDIEDIDDFEDLDDAPAPKKGITKKPAKKAADDDFDDLDDAPRKKGKGRDDDLDDDDDDSPRKKGKAKPKKMPAGTGGPTSEDDRNWAFILYILIFVFPLGGLIWWVMKKGESRFVDYHGKQWINFNITAIVLFFILSIVSIVIGLAVSMLDTTAGFLVGLGIFWIVALALSVISLICFIKGILAACAGNWYQWMMAWQILK